MEFTSRRRFHVALVAPLAVSLTNLSVLWAQSIGGSAATKENLDLTYDKSGSMRDGELDVAKKKVIRNITRHYSSPQSGKRMALS